MGNQRRTCQSPRGQSESLDHSEVVFDYLVDATAVLAECDEATGREVPATEMPIHKADQCEQSGIAAGATFPPMTEFCYIACILLGSERH